MSKIPEELHWQGPCSFWPMGQSKSIFDDESLLGAGVCLWTVKRNDVNHVMYVDIGDNIHDRLQEHLTQYLTGNYVIYDADDLRGLKRTVVYEAQGWPDFLRGYADYGRALHRMLETLRFFIVPLDTDPTLLRRVESGLVKCLWDHSDEAKDFLLNDQPSILIAEEQKSLVRSKCSERIDGLGEFLKV